MTLQQSRRKRSTRSNMASKTADPADALGREIDDAFRDSHGKVIVGTSVEQILSQPDPFAQDAEVFKTMGGLSDTAKKRAYRAFKKVHEGADGAKSNKREQGEGFV